MHMTLIVEAEIKKTNYVFRNFSKTADEQEGNNRVFGWRKKMRT